MNKYMQVWGEKLLCRTSMRIEGRIKARGVCDLHTGPGWRYANISILAEPSDQFDVSVELPIEQQDELKNNGWLEQAVFGILDVLATELTNPVFGLRVRIVAAESDPVASSGLAFRLAGRQAARSLLADSGLALKT